MAKILHYTEAQPRLGYRFVARAIDPHRGDIKIGAAEGCSSGAGQSEYVNPASAMKPQMAFRMPRKFAKGVALDPVYQAGGDAVGPVLEGMRPRCPVPGDEPPRHYGEPIRSGLNALG